MLVSISAIEAKGFDHGVVRSRLADGNWDTWGKLDWITYEAAKPVQPDKPVTGSIVKGSRVKVKSGAKTYDGKGIASFVYAGLMATGLSLIVTAVSAQPLRPAISSSYLGEVRPLRRSPRAAVLRLRRGPRPTMARALRRLSTVTRTP